MAVNGVERAIPTLDSSTPHGMSSALLVDLSRCLHGVIYKEPCPLCRRGRSEGNTWLHRGQRVGTDKDGDAIVVPTNAEIANPLAWRGKKYSLKLPPQVVVADRNEADNPELQLKYKEAVTMMERVLDLFGGREDVVASKDFLVIASEIFDERVRQEQKFGVQDHPDGTSEKHRELSDKKRAANQQAFREGRPTFAKILTEEFFEVLAEEDPKKLYVELNQLAAVCVQWMQKLRREGVAQ